MSNLLHVFPSDRLLVVFTEHFNVDFISLYLILRVDYWRNFVGNINLLLRDAGVHEMLDIPWAGRAHFRRNLELM